MEIRPGFDWPPDYTAVYQRRARMLKELRNDPSKIQSARAYYRSNTIAFIEDWVDTFEPRNAGKPGKLVRMPLIMFPRQREMIDFFEALIAGESNGLVEKTRDAGATWCGCAFSVAKWLHVAGFNIGWGSAIRDKVDKLGVVDTVFEKMRQIIKGLPAELRPIGWKEDEHATFMRLVNPENGSTIVGEAGPQIGRGGRKTVFFKDESAHWENPEAAESALSENTRVQIDISSVFGVGTPFARKAQTGKAFVPSEGVVKDRTNVFVFDWRDHPEKTDAWYEERKRKAEREGLLHLFAQEVDRDYSSSIEGVMIKKEWVEAAVDAHLKLGVEITGRRVSGLDVADEGIDRDALVSVKGILIDYAHAMKFADTGKLTREAIRLSPTNEPVDVQYDSIGHGAGVKSEANRLRDVNQLPSNISFTPWTASAKVLNADKPIFLRDKASPLNKDYYANFKAQAWATVARRFYKTFQAVTEGVEFDPEEIVSISSAIPEIHDLKRELSQATSSLSASTLKLVVDKSPNGTKSPNLADAAIMALFPMKRKGFAMNNVG